MHDPDVLIIGLGPVGAILASVLARSGLSVKIIERDLEVYKQPRAIVLDHEVMRLLNFIDCAEDALACSKPAEGYEFLNADREVLTKRPPFPGLAPTGYSPANLFHQPSLEHAIRAKLAQLPNVDICLGDEFIAMDQDGKRIRSVIRTSNGLTEVTSAFLIGCDGGKSLVRRYLDIQMEDLNFNEPWVVVDVKVPDEDIGLSKNGVQLCDPARPTTSVPSGPNRHRWEFMLKPGERAEDVTKSESLKEWISAWVNPEKIELERSAVYRFHGLVAKKWRRSRAMIVGDAAHQMPPFMGQGLNAGIRDAFNLAWKLVAVAKGQTPLDFLDTVERERSPHVKEVTNGAIAMGRTVCVTDPCEAKARDKKMMEDHKAGRGFAFPGVPRIMFGVLNDATAGSVFPEAFTGDAADPKRVDHAVGYVPLLVLANTNTVSGAELERAKSLRDGDLPIELAALVGASEDIVQLIDKDGHVARLMGEADAMLVKPDRIVFGSGSVGYLADQWSAYLSDELCIKSSAEGAH